MTGKKRTYRVVNLRKPEPEPTQAKVTITPVTVTNAANLQKTIGEYVQELRESVNSNVDALLAKHWNLPPKPHREGQRSISAILDEVQYLKDERAAAREKFVQPKWTRGRGKV